MGLTGSRYQQITLRPTAKSKVRRVPNASTTTRVLGAQVAFSSVVVAITALARHFETIFGSQDGAFAHVYNAIWDYRRLWPTKSSSETASLSLYWKAVR